MYLNADFRGLWLWERQLAKPDSKEDAPESKEETGYSYFE
jgi:hypothetical protein